MKDKVTIQLQGGLSNNLFQIATAYAYSLKHDKELVLTKNKIGITHGKIESYQDNILYKVNFVEQINLKGFTVYQEPHFHYAEIPFIAGDVCLSGYFQSEKHFKLYEKEIKELFSYPDKYKSVVIDAYKDVLKRNTCSIHVRRGDYLSLPDSHPTQGINYYMKAIHKITTDDTLIIVFSDDLEFCRSNFPQIPEKFVFIEGNPDYEDLLLMSFCESKILANSSFSWWAAWLGQTTNQHQKIVAPSKWFGKNIKNDTKDLYCKGWILI